MLVIHGHIALASFAAILGSVRKAYEQMEEIVQQQTGEFSVAWALSKNYFSFMAEPEEERSTAHKAEINELALQDVCFAYGRYPGIERCFHRGKVRRLYCGCG